VSTTIATRPSIHRPRRALLSVAVAATLSVGAGAAAVSLASPHGTTSQTDPAPAAATTVDIQALWNRLSTLPVGDQNNIVAGLAPSVRAQLQAAAEGIAAAAEGH
jgi:hypothetical protein